MKYSFLCIILMKCNFWWYLVGFQKYLYIQLAGMCVGISKTSQKIKLKCLHWSKNVWTSCFIFFIDVIFLELIEDPRRYSFHRFLYQNKHNFFMSVCTLPQLSGGILVIISFIVKLMGHLLWHTCCQELAFMSIYLQIGPSSVEGAVSIICNSKWVVKCLWWVASQKMALHPSGVLFLSSSPWTLSFQTLQSGLCLLCLGLFHSPLNYHVLNSSCPSLLCVSMWLCCLL